MSWSKKLAGDPETVAAKFAAFVEGEKLNTYHSDSTKSMIACMGGAVAAAAQDAAASEKPKVMVVSASGHFDAPLHYGGSATLSIEVMPA